MNRLEQRQFVRQLSRRINDKIIAAIDEGRVPREWNGHELRVLLADLHAESASMSLIRREPRSVAAREYHRIVIERDLI